MTTETNDNTPQPAAIDTRSKEQQIEDMLVSAGAARGELPEQPRSSGHPSMTVKVIPGQVAEYSFHSPQDAALAEQQANEPEGDLPDDGRDLQEGMRHFGSQFEAHQRALKEVRYDPITGVPSHVLQGADRERVEMLSRQAWDSLDWEALRAAKLSNQRDRKAAEKEAQAHAELDRETYLNQQAIRRADEMEIDRRAALIIQQRRGRG